MVAWLDAVEVAQKSGTVEVKQIPGKGNGVVAARAIAKGTTVVTESPCCALQSLGSSSNSQGLILTCGFIQCLKPIEAVGTQLGMLARSVTRSDLTTSYPRAVGVNVADGECLVQVGRLGKPLSSPTTGAGGSGVLIPDVHGEDQEEMTAPIFGCPAQCGVLYCSAECRSAAEASGHPLLCMGRVLEHLSASAAFRDINDMLDAHPLMRFKHHAVATNEVFLMAAQVLSSG